MLLTANAVNILETVNYFPAVEVVLIVFLMLEIEFFRSTFIKNSWIKNLFSTPPPTAFLADGWDSKTLLSWGIEKGH